MVNIVTHIRPKYKILVTSDSGEKNFISHFFNITSMGEKLISKDHLTPAPD
jgi:hypothetical protein